MINENEQDRIDMAKEIAEVRERGVVNMFDRIGVANVLYDMGYDYTAEYIFENREDYIELLALSGNY